MIRLSLLAVVAGLALGAPLAQAADDDPDALIGQGLRLMRRGDYEGAFVAFRRSYQARPTPRSRAEMGLAEQALGRWADAELHLTDALQDTTDAWLAKHRAILEKALAEVRTHLGSLVVTGSPRGAEVEVDGEVRGVLPLARPLRLPVGTIKLRVEAKDYRPREDAVRIREEETARVAVRLTRIAAPPPASAPSPAAAVDVAPPAPASPVSPGGRALRAVGWTALGLGLTAAVVGGGGLLAGPKDNRQRLLAMEGLGLGCLLTLVGAEILILHPWLASSASGSAAGLALQGSF